MALQGHWLCCFVSDEGFRFGCVFMFLFQWAQDPIIKQLGEMDAKSLEELLSEIPLWVKNPDYDRVMTRFVWHVTFLFCTGILHWLYYFLDCEF